MYFEIESVSDHSPTRMNKSVENLLISSHEVISSINSSSLGSQDSPGTLGNGIPCENAQDHGSTTGTDRGSPGLSPNLSPRPSPRSFTKRDLAKQNSSSYSSHKGSINLSKSEDQQIQEVTSRSSDSAEPVKHSANEGKKEPRERSKKKPSWYSVLYPTYKSRSEDFKKIFKDVPDDERLVVDYSCALQREILAHGRLYVTQNYVCFYANIFTWETLVSLRWKDVTSITKEKTAIVIPNAILISTETDKFFLTTFGARDKTYLMLFRVWQNALIGQPMSTTEMWQLVHTSYGAELGLTSDDEDYVPPTSATEDEKLSTRLSVESFSEAEAVSTMDSPVPAVTEPVVEQIEETACEQPPQLVQQSRPQSALDPTDLSDTTESEAEKHALKVGLRGVPTCTSVHKGRQLQKVTLPVHIDQLFTLLFTSSKFFLDFHTARKTTDLVQSAWVQNNQTGQKMRNVSLILSLNQSMGPRTSQVTETQIMLPCSKPGVLYCIDVESLNSGIPYADSFSVLTHYCMLSTSENETSLTIFAQIKYRKSVWAFVRSLIEKNCWAGLDEYFSSLVKALSVECEEVNISGGIKRKARRRRRVTAAGIALQAHPPELSSVVHPVTAAELPHIHSNHEVRNDTSNVLSWVLLVAVLCLTLINGLLYYKLWGLEEAAAYTIMDLHVLKNAPKTEEDWINLLQQQESLHNVEMRKWQRVLHTASQLLRQTEESLTELQMSIHPTASEKMFSVLKPGVKNSRSEQRSNNPEM
ncbi:GRAM domain-containing protein 1B isoform X2 [Orussus abietinus]|uniref:GRAM domain-containing protein 1B isoform X2 n=1 Tax=Orussus abietinus TaxID=222816 RepID=UPI000625F4C0|nr:GRAM domain-containing protein 1B isoform X2 [Orussus abietinus]